MAPADNGPDKIAALINRLSESTQHGLIEWSLSDRRFAYIYSAKSSSVIIASIDNDGQIPFELQILNRNGEVIETVRSHLRDENDGYVLNRNFGRPLESLYERVRRAVTGVDLAIDEILMELPTIDDEPPF